MGAKRYFFRAIEIELRYVYRTYGLDRTYGLYWSSRYGHKYWRNRIHWPDRSHWPHGSNRLHRADRFHWCHRLHRRNRLHGAYR